MRAAMIYPHRSEDRDRQLAARMGDTLADAMRHRGLRFVVPNPS